MDYLAYQWNGTLTNVSSHENATLIDTLHRAHSTGITLNACKPSMTNELYNEWNELNDYTVSLKYKIIMYSNHHTDKCSSKIADILDRVAKKTLLIIIIYYRHRTRSTLSKLAKQK